MSVDFTAIDFETANSSSASACSVGLVKVRSGRIVDRAAWLIRPPAGHDAFSEWNIRIHGIHAEDVVDAAGWREQFPELLEFADGDILVAHNAGFDMGVIRGACAATGVECPALPYACSLQIARRTYALESYRLPAAAHAAGYSDFAHHDALADSEACAAIMVDAAACHGAASLFELAAATRTQIRRIGEAGEVGARRAARSAQGTHPRFSRA